MQKRLWLSVFLVGCSGLVGCTDNKNEENKEVVAEVTNLIGKIGDFNKKREETKSRAKVRLTQVRMEYVKQNILEFKFRYIKLPESFDDLTSCTKLTGMGCTILIDDEERLNDEWGNRLIYEKIDDRNYKLTSFGADGKEGGEGFDADIEIATK